MAEPRVKVETPKTKEYVCLSRVKHDGKIYRRMSPIDLTEKQAKSLLSKGVIEEATKPEETK